MSAAARVAAGDVPNANVNGARDAFQCARRVAT